MADDKKVKELSDESLENAAGGYVAQDRFGLWRVYNDRTGDFIDNNMYGREEDARAVAKAHGVSDAARPYNKGK